MLISTQTLIDLYAVFTDTYISKAEETSYHNLWLDEDKKVSVLSSQEGVTGSQVNLKKWLKCVTLTQCPYLNCDHTAIENKGLKYDTFQVNTVGTKCKLQV